MFLALASVPHAYAWPQQYDPAHHWVLSTLAAALPLAVLLIALIGLRAKAHVSALLALSSALLIAIALFRMPLGLALLSTAFGAAYGLFPTFWIVFPVILLYQLTIRAGRLEILQRCLVDVTADSRLQLLLIAFSFGAFFEGAAGFGTPVAVCGSILIGLGFGPIEAAGLALLANTAPVAFGGLGIPIIALHGVTGLDTLLLARVISGLLAPFCVLVPFWLIWAYAGFRAMVEVWPAILVTGATFSITQLVVASIQGPALVDICASVASMAALILFLRIWKPKRILNARRQDVTHLPLGARGSSRGELLRASVPWLILTLLVSMWGAPTLARGLDLISTIHIPVPGLDMAVLRMPPAVVAPAAESAIFTFNWLSATGTAIFIAALIAALAMGLGPRVIGREFIRTVVSTRYTALTIAALMGFGFLIRFGGLDGTLGLAFARTGVLYPFFGTLIGWIGTASTGSDTSSNVLFGSLQKLTAQQLKISPYLMCAANSGGGVMGKMIAPQSVVVATTATNNYGKEGTILRFVFLHSIALACLMGVLVSIVSHWPRLTSLLLR